MKGRGLMVFVFASLPSPDPTEKRVGSPSPHAGRGLLGLDDTKNLVRQTGTNLLQDRFEIGEHFVIVES